MSRQRGSTPLKINVSNRASRRFLTGFTLIELLVVIAIIALLVSILMPALARAKTQAKEVICKTRLRQIAMAFLAFASANNGFFVSIVGYVGDDQIEERGSSGWLTMMPPGAGPTLRICPMATKSIMRIGPSAFSAWDSRTDFQGNIDWAPGPADAGRKEESYIGSYGANAWCGHPLAYYGKVWGHPTKFNWRTPNVKGAANIPMVLDASWVFGLPYHNAYHAQPPEYDGQPGWTNMRTFCLNRHNGHINGAFLDSSVRKIGLKEMWTLKWHRRFDINNEYTIAGGVVRTQWPKWMQKFPDY